MAATLIPYAPGSYVGKGVKLARGFDKSVDLSKIASKALEAISVGKKSDRALDSAKIIEKVIHGNSLKSTKQTYGYILRHNTTNEILKFGETSKGVARYTKSYYITNNCEMEIITSGSKYDMHYWQNNQIITFIDTFGKKPNLNNSLW